MSSSFLSGLFHSCLHYGLPFSESRSFASLVAGGYCYSAAHSYFIFIDVYLPSLHDINGVIKHYFNHNNNMNLRTTKRLHITSSCSCRWPPCLLRSSDDYSYGCTYVSYLYNYYSALIVSPLHRISRFVILYPGCQRVLLSVPVRPRHCQYRPLALLPPVAVHGGAGHSVLLAHA